MSILKKASIDTGLAVAELLRLARSAPRRYKTYPLAKRNGTGYRIVAQPSKEVKLVQRWLARNVLSSLPVHDCAYAYRKGLSIRDNAAQHAKNRFLLKLDFDSFFPSISDNDLLSHMRKYSKFAYSDEELWFFCRMTMWKRKGTDHLQLCIGGPSSPALSNSIMFDFDSAIAKACMARDVVYTRYADDLTFSTSIPGTLETIPKLVSKQCTSLEYPRLKINDKKTVATSMKHSRFVTGLVLNNEGQVSLGRRRKREISAMVHHFTADKLDENARAKLRGLLAFALDIEPKFVERLETKYGKACIDAALRGFDLSAI